MFLNNMCINSITNPSWCLSCWTAVTLFLKVDLLSFPGEICSCWTLRCTKTCKVLPDPTAIRSQSHYLHVSIKLCSVHSQSDQAVFILIPSLELIVSAPSYIPIQTFSWPDGAPELFCHLFWRAMISSIIV